MNKITSIILHYNRQNNIMPIVNAIKEQTIESDIIIWDNSNDLVEIPGVALIKSSKNFICRPRFILCGLVQTSYIFNQDDDHIIKDKSLFEKLIDDSTKRNNTVFYGWPARKQYIDNKYSKEPEDKITDFVNTGISFFPTELSNYIKMNPYFCDESFIMTEQEYKYADDHWISAQMLFKLDSKILYDGMDKLSDCGHGLSRDQEHISIREEMSKRFFK